MKKKGLCAILVIGIILVGLAGYFYFNGGDNTDTREARTSNTNITEEKTTGATKDMNSEGNTTASDNKINKDLTTESVFTDNVTTTTEQKKELPKDYVWDTERLGEPPQIVYDFADNQERLESIIKEAEGIISEGNGFSTGYENKETIYYYSGGENIKNKIDKPMRKNIEYILINTKFYELTKSESGYWTIYYSQEEEQEHFIFTMEYHAGMTDEQAYEEGYYRVVGDWFFWKIWKI